MTFKPIAEMTSLEMLDEAAAIIRREWLHVNRESGERECDECRVNLEFEKHRDGCEVGRVIELLNNVEVVK